MIQKSSLLSSEELTTRLNQDNPYKPGTLVAPRIGYFYPEVSAPPGISPPSLDAPHPYGIILGRCLENNETMGREFYRVRFGGTTYERVHPIELEIINEV
jgi:hypothetical protein